MPVLVPVPVPVPVPVLEILLCLCLLTYYTILTLHTYLTGAVFKISEEPGPVKKQKTGSKWTVQRATSTCACACACACVCACARSVAVDYRLEAIGYRLGCLLLVCSWFVVCCLCLSLVVCSRSLDTRKMSADIHRCSISMLIDFRFTMLVNARLLIFSFRIPPRL